MCNSNSIWWWFRWREWSSVEELVGHAQYSFRGIWLRLKEERRGFDPTVLVVLSPPFVHHCRPVLPGICSDYTEAFVWPKTLQIHVLTLALGSRKLAQLLVSVSQIPSPDDSNCRPSPIHNEEWHSNLTQTKTQFCWLLYRVSANQVLRTEDDFL